MVIAFSLTLFNANGGNALIEEKLMANGVALLIKRKILVRFLSAPKNVVTLMYDECQDYLDGWWKMILMISVPIVGGGSLSLGILLCCLFC